VLTLLLNAHKTDSSATSAHTIALGDGLQGGVVAKELSFVIFARDDKGGYCLSCFLALRTLGGKTHKMRVDFLPVIDHESIVSGQIIMF